MAKEDPDGGDKKKEVTVTPEELKNFATAIRNLLPDIDNSKVELDKINITPGNFADALVFKKTIGSDAGGRANIYSQHLTSLHIALSNFADKLDEIAKNYTSAEEFNKGIAQKLDELRNDVEPYLPGAPTGG
jgi:hypothetical protein